MNAVKLRTLIIAGLLALIAGACTSGSDAAQPAETASSQAPVAPETPITGSGVDEAGQVQSAGDETPADPPAADSDVGETARGDTSASAVFVGCDEEGDFDILCEAYDILTREYVDELDPAVLAGGATTGIAEFAADSGSASTGGDIVCQGPTTDFGPTCEAAAVALDTADLETVAEAAVQGMLTFGLDDPNTVYLPPDALARIQEENSGEISGIGALVSTEQPGPDGDSVQCFIISATCRMSIVGLIADSPAERGGIEVGDVTVTVDGESVRGWTADEVVAAVRGPDGSEVLLGMERDGDVIEFRITRAPIVIPVTTSELLDESIGYVALSQFTNNSDDLLHDELETLLGQGATSLILDLRNNPGGALTASVNIASEFLSDGLVLRTESPGEDRSYEVSGDGLVSDPAIEVVVLVNGGSASASEVVSAALQEAGRATIVGEATFGKNTVQRQFNLSNGGAIKVTIARWVTPDGASFGGGGVLPDVVVETSPDDSSDLVLERAIALLES
jgi:carboxyl-terminal processing protease